MREVYERTGTCLLSVLNGIVNVIETGVGRERVRWLPNSNCTGSARGWRTLLERCSCYYYTFVYFK